mmetsp:Transcript_22473/g.32803  ORF Transcript_22473/g.32803 Transcript_22473/m.32803 type:complete len:1051 (+) Transcript_22473:62-3214(+)
MNPTIKENGDVRADYEEVRQRRLANPSLVEGNSPRVEEASGNHVKKKRPDDDSSPVSLSSSQGSPMKGTDRHARALNLVLEQIFQISLRKDVSHPIFRIERPNDDELITPSNLSEFVIMRMMDGNNIGLGGCVGYITACYRRLVQKQSSCSDKIKDDLSSCKEQIVSFLASAVNEPDIFGQSGLSDLLKILGQAGGDVVITTLMREFADEMTNHGSFDEVSKNMIVMCYEGLDPTSAFPMTVRSVFDDITEPMSALITLVRADKRYAAAVTSSQVFLADPRLLFASPPDIMSAQMRFGAKVLEKGGVAGAAMEHQTLLGRVLRVAPDIRDPKVTELFKDTLKQSRPVVEGNIGSLRTKMTYVQQQATDLVMSLLKAGAQPKAMTLKWLTQALYFNREAEKDRPSPLVASSTGFMLNLCGVLLRLAKPITEDPVKLEKVDWGFIHWGAEYLSRPGLASQAEKFFSQDCTRLMLPTDEDAGVSTPVTTTDFNFISQSFFSCWRALHLGVVQECVKYPHIMRALNRLHSDLMRGSPQAMQHLVMKLTMDAMLLSSDLMSDVAMFCSACASSLLQKLNVSSTVNPAASIGEDWIVPIDRFSSCEKKILMGTPEHFVDDLAELLLFIAKTDPRLLSLKPLDPVLDLVIYLVRRPSAVSSPHLRAKLGQVLYYVFLPTSERVGEERYTPPGPSIPDGPQCRLLGSHPVAEKYLAPALLLLYGDVERTGFYEKLMNRRCIMVVLRHLWTLSSHRPAFRAIASGTGDTAGDKTNFIKFANGLLNETNALVGSTLEKLQEIKQTQLLMQNAQEWSSMSEEDRKRVMEIYDQNEREVTGKSDLCMETLNMLNYLTSDSHIRLPFLLDEILPRFTSMMLNVISKLVGQKGLEIKVDNMEKYNFNPKAILMEICVTMTHFSSYERFWTAVAGDGFFETKDGRYPLEKALSTVKKLGLLNEQQIESLASLVENAVRARANFKNIDDLIQDAPEEFLDPLMSTIMRDPVFLPTSSSTLDRATITQHLLNDEIDPFNRKPLSVDMLVPQTDLKLRIDAWLRERGL